MAAAARIAWPGLVLALAALLVLFRDTLRWLWQVPFAGDDRRLNLGLLLIFAGLLLRRLRRLHARHGSLLDWPRDLRDPQRQAPLALLGGSLLAALLLRRIIGESTPTAVCVLLTIYGFLGLFLAPAHVRAGLPGLLLLLASLPFAALAEGYAGLLARIVTAEAVQQSLAALHIAALPVSSILILERGIAHIDIPCSGLRGLWSGVLAYLLLTWLDRRRLGLPWLLGLVLMQGLLVLANLGRVFLLVLLAHVAALPGLAESLHVPLGLFGFVLCVAAAFFYLRHLVPLRATASDTPTLGSALPSPDPAAQSRPPAFWLLPSLALLFLGLCLVDRVRPAPTSPPPLTVRFPADLDTQPLPLSPGEREIFGRFGAHADKRRVPGGSLIVVQAPTLGAFRAHHPPEVCLLASGLRVSHAATIEVGPQAQARWLRLQERPAPRAGHDLASPPPSQRSGIYWFQSAEGTTPHILTRILRQLGSRRPQTWLLVTLISDEQPGPGAEPSAAQTAADASLQAVARRIHATLAHALRAEANSGDRP